MYIPQPNRHYKYFPKLNLKSVSTNFQKKCPVSISQDIHISNKSVVSDKKERGSISYEKPTTTVHDYDNVKELNLHRPFTSSNYKNPNNKRTKEEYKLGILTFQNNTCLNIPIQCGGLYPLSGLSIMLPQSMHSISPNQMSNLLDDCFILHAVKLINNQFPRKKGFFSKKFQTIKDVLSWSSEFVGSSISKSDDKLVKKNACCIFKKIQIYMYDRPARAYTRNKALLDIVCKGWQYPVLRDEIFLQLVKQTTHNPSTTSLQLGWELMAICLKIFPPSTQLLHLLEIYIRRHRKFGNKDIAVYADVCLERLIKMSSSGPRRGVQKPTIEEIQNAMNTILSPSMFGTSLIELMEMQRSIPNYTHLNLPWIQIALSSTILQLGGVTTEGIFRIPGDVDKVNCLKAKCDQWTIPIQQIVEPHVPASLLKLWYRELADPLIPDWLYADCISATTADQCVQITDKLPTIHRNVMIYLVQFLQLFALPKHVAYTKMDVNNLALVMAPNCFRCRCNNPRDIVENSKKEMQFLRMLITNWRTSHPGQLNFNVNQNKQHDLQNGMDNDGGDKEKDEFESSSNDSFMCSL